MLTDIGMPKAKGFEYEDILYWNLELVEVIRLERCRLQEARRLNDPKSFSESVFEFCKPKDETDKSFEYIQPKSYR